MNKAARSRLRQIVNQVRQLIEEDVRRSLRRLRITRDEGHQGHERLDHLSEEDLSARTNILVILQKEQKGRTTPKDAYDRYVRHVGFTYLNRLAALRTMEVRGLLKEETIRRRLEYGDRSEREYKLLERFPHYNAQTLLKESLVEAFNEVSSEIKVLFDINDEYSIFFPTTRTTKELIRLLTEEIPEEDWKQDDIIGWIYQYYNSEARKEYRKRKRKPDPDDIPVINQFYTPRWLVRALVDNTLGRLWLEMKGSAPKSGKIDFTAQNELQHSSENTVDEFCTYLFPLKSHHSRKSKKVRDIKILDPACGSGHFLIYAFDVLYRMYLEDEPDTPKEKIPQLILENNLFGIDIDLRAVQLAALSLYLKTKQYNPQLKIEQMNLVCADARIIDGDIQKQFLKRLTGPKRVQQIFATIFRDLEYTYEIGSLLKVIQPFERLLKEMKGQATFAVKVKGQTSFTSKGKLEGQNGFYISSIRPKKLFSHMIQLIRDFEDEGVEKQDMGTILFAAEAKKSTGLLALLTQKYDVIVMNPPYGDMSAGTKAYAKKNYSRTHYDFYSAFLEQAIDLCEQNGLVGALIGRTFMFLKWYEKVRTEILYNDSNPEIVFDLNSTPSDSILDEATGRWAAIVAKKSSKDYPLDLECLFLRLTTYNGEKEKIHAWEEILKQTRRGGEHRSLYKKRLNSLKKLPRMPYSYWVPERLAKLFEKHSPLDKDNAGKPTTSKIADLKQGLATADDRRFTRYWWEVSVDKIASNRDETKHGKKWVPYVKGGDAYYSNILQVVNWENDGQTIKEFADSTGRPRVQNENYYFKSGLCWSDVASSILIDMRILPSGVIFGHTGHASFYGKRASVWALMAFLNSSLNACLYLALDPTLHHRPIGYMAQMPISPEIRFNEVLNRLSKEAYDLKRENQTGNEISNLFIEPWILQVIDRSIMLKKPHSRFPLSCDFEWSEWLCAKEIQNIIGSPEMSIRDLAKLAIKRETSFRRRLHDLQSQIDDEVYKIYGIEGRERELIERELWILGGYSKTFNHTKEEAIKPKLMELDHVFRLLSYYVKLCIEQNEDGIVPLFELVGEVNKRIVIDFGKENASRVESEIEEMIGSKLEEWIAKDFFKFHMSLYGEHHRPPKPIFWQLSSRHFSKKKGSLGVFNCFLHYFKLDRDTIPKVRANYLRFMKDQFEREVKRLQKELQHSREIEDGILERKASKEYEESFKILEELQDFEKELERIHNPRKDKIKLDSRSSWVKKAIVEIRDNGWTPILDYGVGVNIQPLIEANLLHKAAERVK